MLGTLIAATPRFLFKVCEFHGKFMPLASGKTGYMPCHYTAIASYMVGLLIFLMGAALLLAKSGDAVRLLAMVLGGAAVAVILIPSVFPICPNPDDPCNHGAKPMLMVLGIVTLIVSGWLGLSSRRPAGHHSGSVPSAT